MTDISKGKRARSSVFSAVLSWLSAEVVPLVQPKLAKILAAELQRHFDEHLLPELHRRVEAIVEDRLSERIEAIIDREFQRRREAIIDSEIAATESPTANKILVERFTHVFQENLWGAIETVSGFGSRRDSLSVTEALSALKIGKTKVDFMSMNDIPCGDFNWIEVFLKSAPEVFYKGYDIVSTLIEKNRMSYPNYRFGILDITSTLPPYADLIFSKDLFNHLTYEDISKAIENMKRSRAKYLLASNNFDFPNQELPANIGGCSRYLNLCSEPFNFPNPIWHTNYMGLWKLSDIKVKE
jgi:hypothetical protein